MKLSPLHKAILRGILRDKETLAALCWTDEQFRGKGLAPLRSRIAEAQGGVVRPDLRAWLRRTPTGSEQVMATHAYRRLEAAGLLVRYNRHGTSDRTTHLQLTAEGEAIARKLTKAK